MAKRRHYMGPRHPVTGEPTAHLPAQLEFLKSEEKSLIYSGGHGSGKTEALVDCLLLSAAYWNRGLPHLILAQTHRDLKNVILPKLLGRFPAKTVGQTDMDKIQPGQLSPVIEAVSLGDQWIRLRGGSIVYYGSADSPKANEGQTVVAAFGDEMRLWKADAYRRMVSRVRLPGPYPMIRGATTPGPGTWLHGLVQSGAMGVVTAKTTANPYNDEAYAETMKASMSAEAWRVYGEGEWIAMSGQVFADYGEENNIDYQWDPNLPVKIGLDFGYRKPAVIFLQEDKDGRIIAFDEIVQEGLSTERLAHMITDKPYAITEAAVDPAGTQHGQATGMQPVNVLRDILRVKWPSVRVVYQTDPSIRAIPFGVDTVRSLICNANGYRRLYVTNDMASRRYGSTKVGLHQSLLGLTYPEKEGGSSAEKPVKDGMHDHFYDALSYACRCFWLPRHRKPIQHNTDRGRIESPFSAGDVGGWSDMGA